MNSFFNHGISYAKRGIIDSAYIFLEKAYLTDWEIFYYKTQSKKLWDEELLREDKFKYLKDSCNKKYSKLDTSLINEVMQIEFLDQLYRGFLSDSVRNEFGRGSVQDEIILTKRRKQDQENLQRVEKIIAKYGYPGVSLVGKKYSRAVFLVIQHSNIPTMVKYLPLLKDLAQKGELPIKTVALMEDRVLLGEGKKQIYGSQIMTDYNGKTFVRPIEDPDNVDARRSAIGLNPMAEYVKTWKITWNLEEFKREMQINEEKNKIIKRE